MKLLAASLVPHDANLACLDGDRLRYLKLERTRQQKRFGFDHLVDWRSELRDLWGMDPSDADDTVFHFDPGALPARLRAELPPDLLARLASDRTKAERLPRAVCDYLGVRQGWLGSHHHAHALGSWMLGPHEPDVHIVIDGLGDGRPWSVYRGGAPAALGDIRNGSIGWGMREAGRLLEVQAGHYNDIAGKLMGLQAFGRVDAGFLAQLEAFGFEQLKEVWSAEHWTAWKGDPLLARLTRLDWVATVHRYMGELLVAFFRRFAAPGELVSYSGGVAQNVVWNAMLREHFPRLVIPPHCSDEGLSLGGIEWLRREHGLPPLQLPGFPCAQADAAVPPPSDRTINSAAQVLAAGRVLGWYQGHGEIGPRALGNRSILLDPRLPEGRRLLNRVKRRENYRPFGAAVLREHFDDWFRGPADGFMLYACEVKDDRLPALAHVDGSCRVQLVGEENPVFRALLARFHHLTGCPVLVNTSLNVAGRPLAARPEHALQLFLDSELDALAVGDDLRLR